MSKMFLVCFCTAVFLFTGLCAENDPVKESPAQTSAVPEKATLAVCLE